MPQTHELSAQEKRALVVRLRAGKNKAKRERPRRLREVERRIDAVGRALDNRPDAFEERHALRVELEDLGSERIALKYGGR